MVSLRVNANLKTPLRYILQSQIEIVLIITFPYRRVGLNSQQTKGARVTLYSTILATSETFKQIVDRIKSQC